MIDVSQILHSILWPILGLVAFLFIVTLIFALLPRVSRNKNGDDGADRPIYKYNAKKYFLTRSEHAFYDLLGQAVGKDYRIFAQVHLPSIVDHKVPGQNWKPAFSHINGKSVDFVLCDKDSLSPVLAIELDDRSHERPDRAERDVEVERILEMADVPLLRIADGRFETLESIASRVQGSLAK